ncbi:MAG TPA: redox-sensing transcriptional repressor Rex [Halanaerobiaceae bacterium]|jgi:redox-sensing transcriptional repressor|nr:redox-sensing transcriptional repressor Rex [Bacillota bacterium]HHU92169.1 redox-sensing transcriptional repressor Rex [Halanaerobiaceae bacterium]HOA41381.1 redox-sensing transcriptional repressor Rex [Halanaerobiales bacterium]HPZ63743.1 redox-sensing transcriptional repressor Rex [Halanaerobiales bacterium]HQD04739.1 redox-sensing transcriptional repressor Rex [Halanaerobiales bacterium]
MKRSNYIPKATIERLPLYYRCLEKLSAYEQDEVVSSRELGERLGIPPTQVRKDLSYYGEFGRRGVGYDIEDLKKSLAKILGINKTWPAVLVGAGNLGRALVNYEGFQKMGLQITDVIDADLDKIGNNVGEITVRSTKDLAEIVKNKQVKIGIIAVPVNAAQEVTDLLIAAGIKSIWNFAPTRLVVPEGILVRNEDLSVGIVSLIYHLSWENQ